MTIKTTEMDATTTRTTYCYSYHRISTKKQMQGGGIKRQLDASAAFCEEQGWIMDTTFKLTDIGKSAYHGANLDDRAALGGFLNAVDQGLVKRPAVLLVENLDRLSRANIMDALELFIRIMNAGITICTHQDRMIYSKEELKNNFAPLIISITLMCRSHDESLVKSRRGKANWGQIREKLKNGQVGSKRIYPEWIQIKNGEPVVIEEKAAIVRKLFDLNITQNMSFSTMLKFIRDNYGDKFTISYSNLRRLFHQKRVLGIYEPREAVSTDHGKKFVATQEQIYAYPAIIDENTFYAAQAAINKRKVIRSGRPVKKSINFFRSKMNCGHCGFTYVTSTSGSSSVYRCKRRSSYKADCGQRSTLVVSHFQPVLLHALSLIEKDDILENASNRKKAKLTKEINAKEAELQEKQSRIDNLAELVELGSKTGLQRLAKLEKEVAAIALNIEIMTDQLDMLSSPMMLASLEHLNDFHKRFRLDQATVDDQEPFIEALHHTIEKITIHSPEMEKHRTIAMIRLLSGINIKIVVYKDYSADVYKGRSRIGRYTPGG